MVVAIVTVAVFVHRAVVVMMMVVVAAVFCSSALSFSFLRWKVT